MKPYGGERAQLARARHSADNNRKRKTHREALDAEERAAKRKARTEGEAEIREAVACMAAAEDDIPGDDVMRCAPDCPVCSGDPETAEDVFERTRGMRRAANMAVMGWSTS